MKPSLYLFDKKSRGQDIITNYFHHEALEELEKNKVCFSVNRRRTTVYNPPKPSILSRCIGNGSVVRLWTVFRFV